MGFAETWRNRFSFFFIEKIETQLIAISNYEQEFVFCSVRFSELLGKIENRDQLKARFHFLRKISIRAIKVAERLEMNSYHQHLLTNLAFAYHVMNLSNDLKYNLLSKADSIKNLYNLEPIPSKIGFT